MWDHKQHHVPVRGSPLVQLSENSSSEFLLDVFPSKTLKEIFYSTKTLLKTKIHKGDHICSVKWKESRNDLGFLPVGNGNEKRDGTLVWRGELKHIHAAPSRTHFRERTAPASSLAFVPQETGDNPHPRSKFRLCVPSSSPVINKVHYTKKS